MSGVGPVFGRAAWDKTRGSRCHRVKDIGRLLGQGQMPDLSLRGLTQVTFPS